MLILFNLLSFRNYDSYSISDEIVRYVKLIEKELEDSKKITRKEIINHIFLKLNSNLVT